MHRYSNLQTGDRPSVIGGDVILARVSRGRHARVGDPVNVRRFRDHKGMFQLDRDESGKVVLRARLVLSPRGVLRVQGADGLGQPTVADEATGLLNLLRAAEVSAPEADVYRRRLADRLGFPTYAHLWDAVVATGGVTGTRALRELVAFAFEKEGK